MSTNRNRNLNEKVADNRSYRILFLEHYYPPFYDEYFIAHRSKGQRHKMTRKWKKREICQFEVRMYRSWKHNRTVQYKMQPAEHQEDVS